MPVTPEEKQKYIDFASGIVQRLGCLTVEGTDIVWHYTNGDALIAILETGTLFATQVACLNDSTEVLYGTNLLSDELAALQAGSQLSTVETSFLETFFKNSKDNANLPSNWFVTCFSKQRDDLSQWRAYGGGENGYAIAFLVGAFFGHGCKVVKVNYDRELHLQCAKEIARAMVDFYKEGFEARTSEEDKKAWTEEFLVEWEKWIGQLAPMVKDPSFAGENEYRIIHHFQEYELGKLRFRQKQSLMSLHLPLVFPPPEYATSSSLLPVREIMAGPGRHKEQSRLAAQLLLRQRGYSAPISATISDIPFQNT